MRDVAVDVAELASRDVTWEVMSQQIKDLILLADATGQIFYASPACRRLGYRQQDIVGRKGSDFVHPDDAASFTADMAALLSDEGAASTRHEHWFRKKDGSWVCLEGNPSVLRGPDGEAVGILTVLRDITDRPATARKPPPSA